MGLVPPSRLELLQQGPAGRADDPRQLRTVRPLGGGRDRLADAGNSHSRPCSAAHCYLASLYVLTVLTLKRESLAFGVVAMRADAAARRRGRQPDDDRRALHGVLGLGSGVRPFGNQRQALGVAGDRRHRRHRHSRQVHDGAVRAVARTLHVLSIRLAAAFKFPLARFSADDRDCRARWRADSDLELRSTTGSHCITSADRRAPSDGWRWFGRTQFLGGQFGILLGFWFVVYAAAMCCYRPSVDTDADRRFLWWMSAPTSAAFLLLSLRTTGQLNWAVTAYLSGGVLSAAWLSERADMRGWRIGTSHHRRSRVGVNRHGSLPKLAAAALALDRRHADNSTSASSPPDRSDGAIARLPNISRSRR